MILVKILVFLVMLSIIVIVHELGHFLSAKKFGILCHEFSIGMGPAIYKKKKGETTIAIRAFPIGGYVSMAGEQFSEDIIKVGDKIGLNLKNKEAYEIVLDDKTVCDVRGRVVKKELYSRHGEALEIELCLDDNIKDEDLPTEGESYAVKEDAFIVDGATRIQIAPFNRCFESKKIWQRFVVMFAGPFMNMVLAIFIYLICSFIQGTPKYSSSEIGEVSENYPASSVLEKGDVIEEVRISDNLSYKISSWRDFQDAMDKALENGCYEISLTISRNGEIITKNIKPNVYVNSVGISSAIDTNSKYYNKDNTLQGALVGDYGLRYKNDVDSKETQISTGDIIYAINVYNHNEEYNKDAWIPINSWQDLIINLKDLDVANIYFRYYDVSVDDSGVFSYTKSSTRGDDDTVEYHKEMLVESYGNEVLNSQHVEKIRLLVGISPVYHHAFFESIKEAGLNFWDDFTLIFNTLKIIIHPSGVRQVGVSNLSGVVGIYSTMGTYMSAGIIALLLFVALLSVNIGVVNLLPIPALDGGRILFVLIEGITHKPLNRKVEAIINNIMFILLMVFMVYVLYNDITRLIK